MTEQIIFADFIQDRKVKIYQDKNLDSDKTEYKVYVQVFTTDNLPFSPITGDLSNKYFNYDRVSTNEVIVDNVEGNFFNTVTQKYEVTDHTFVVGHVKKQNVDQNTAIVEMTNAVNQIIEELNKPILHPLMPMPQIMTDVERAQQVIEDRNIKISQLSKESGISAYTLYNYRKNPTSLQKASNSTINYLVTEYYEKYFNRNEIDRFRFMLIRAVLAYLKENKKEQADYEPVYELYKMCQKADWRHLAKMEEIWRAFYSVDNQF